MGLIGSYLGLLYCGGIGFYLSPISFLKDPLVWIKALSKYQGTHTQAPSFAYALVVRKYKEFISNKSNQILQYDLSNVQHMINAAEPVDCSAVLAFHDTFSKFGLKSDVLKPTYGLAEHTVFVCSGGDQILTLDKLALENDKIDIISHSTISSIVSNKSIELHNDKYINIVGCGYPFHSIDVDVIIVNHDTFTIQIPDTVGEIWVRSPSKALGYWDNQKQTSDDFNAKLSDSNHSNNSLEYLRTGDLGFLYENELFICGRLKDLIIIRGTNHYPQDIEKCGEKNENLRPGCSAAFAVKSSDSDSETVVYVAELKESLTSSYEEIAESCRVDISKEHGIALSNILLLKTRSIPKTTSGKIARSWCKRGYLNNTLNVLYRWDSPNNVEVQNNESSYKNINDANVRETDELVPNEQSAEFIRSLSINELTKRVGISLVQVSATSPTPLQLPINLDASLTSLGLDSLTIAQFKGILENQYYCNVPDEYLFTNICTIYELALAIQIGELTPSQKQQLDSSHNQDGNSAVVVDHKEHLCPWFIWCC
eukprot:gene16869-22357_t